MDVDLDCAASVDPLKIFERSVKASMYQNKKLLSHPCGVYLQDVPTDPISGLAAAPYEIAESLGCFKIDFLHNRVYDNFASREDIRELLKYDPDWTLLQVPSVVSQLYQLNKQLEILQQTKPDSVITLADTLALIRPQKRFMLKKYLENPDKIRPMLYAQGEAGGYAFKKAHAIAYALVNVLQLHLIKGGLTF